ncbi:hypothetical protein TNCV_4354531 [Trichonephila clavipes]|nr:hypothetical protein TNCV_4354531 [Trichonephila clavipes]
MTVVIKDQLSVAQLTGMTVRNGFVWVQLRSGHTRAQRHMVGLKAYPNCLNCNVTQAAPAHILACIVCHKSQLLSSTAAALLFFKNARVHGLDLDVSADQVE